MKKYLGTISILITNRQSNVAEVQKILTENGHIIMARMGVNPQRACLENCTGIISLIVEGDRAEIGGLHKKLDSLYGVVAKKTIF